MDQQLFALGLFVFGFTLLFIMPAAQHRSWKNIGSKPPAGDAVVMMMRFMGLFLLLIGFLIISGAINIESIIPKETNGQPG